MSLTEQQASRQTSLGRIMPKVLLALLLVVGVSAGYMLWWSQPSAFHGYGDEIGGTVKVGETFNASMGAPYDSVSLHHVRPVVVRNSANAKVEFVVCDYKTDFQVGADTGSLERYCSRTSPIDGHHLRAFNQTDESIVIRITPRKAGVIHLDGMTINYSRGARHLWQSGDEQAGIAIKLIAK